VKNRDIGFLIASEIILGCNYTHFIICNKLICVLLVGGQHMWLLSHDRIEDKQFPNKNKQSSFN
jgi:hypothetical protein